MTKYICKVCDEKDPCILFMNEKMPDLPMRCPFYEDNEAIWEICKEEI